VFVLDHFGEFPGFLAFMIASIISRLDMPLPDEPVPGADGDGTDGEGVCIGRETFASGVDLLVPGPRSVEFP